MVCKEDVVSWFNELESYKRIETMCTLLNMCLPFELRFLGTCIEGLGRRDFQLLRGVSHSVNTAKELTAIYDSCLTGGPSDQRIRRKLALYVALLRFGKIDCVNDLFRVLAGWELNDLLNVPSGVPLEEILLLYTLAHWHPVFNFEQRQHCGNIVKRLTEERLAQNTMGYHTQGGLKNLTRPMTQMSASMQDHIPLVMQIPTTNTTQTQMSTHSMPNSVHIGGDMTPITNISPVPSNSSIISNMSVQGPGLMALTPTHLTNEALLQGGHVLQPIISTGNEFTVPYGPWTRATAMVPPMGPHSHHEQVVSFTTSPAPAYSQPGSPAHSRAGSPSHNPARTNNPVRTGPAGRGAQRRPSADHTPPPPAPPLQLQQTGPPPVSVSVPAPQPAPVVPVPAPTAVITSQDTPPVTTQMREPNASIVRPSKMDANLTKASMKHIRNFTLHEVSHMDEEKIGIPSGTMSELRTIVNCNGVCITNCANTGLNNCQYSMNRAKHSQAQQTQPTYCASQLHALRLDADSSLHQSSASESGSSGSAGHSPPDTPALVAAPPPGRAKERCRLNGRLDKAFPREPNAVAMSVTTPYYLPHHFSSSTRSVFGFPHSYRAPPLPFQPSPNGDILYPFPPHPYLQPVAVYPAPQRSCYNCGAAGHSGQDCKELTMEEIARPGLYQLDYTTNNTTSPPDLTTDK